MSQVCIVLWMFSTNTFIHNVCHTPVLCNSKQHHDKVYICDMV